MSTHLSQTMHQSLSTALEHIVHIIAQNRVCEALCFKGVKSLAKLGSAPEGIYAYA